MRVQKDTRRIRGLQSEKSDTGWRVYTALASTVCESFRALLLRVLLLLGAALLLTKKVKIAPQQPVDVRIEAAALGDAP